MFYGEFSNEEDVCKEFAIDSIDGVIIFAAYEIDGYDGSADVIFVSQGKFFHVQGSHCSCYGLEDQWEPEEMPIEALRHIVNKGYGPLNTFRDPLNAMFEQLETMNMMGASPAAIQVAAKLAFG